MQRKLKVGDLVKASYGYHAGKSIGIIIETESDVCRVVWRCKTKQGTVKILRFNEITAQLKPTFENGTGFKNLGLDLCAHFTFQLSQNPSFRFQFTIQILE